MRCALQIHQSASDIGWHTTSRGAAQRFPSLRPRLSDAQPSAEWAYTTAGTRFFVPPALLLCVRTDAAHGPARGSSG
jgi:hypothetical protein